MKKLLVLVLIMACNTSSLQLLAQEGSFVREYLERLENSRRYLVLVAESMPEENYTYKPTPGSMSFA